MLDRRREIVEEGVTLIVMSFSADSFQDYKPHRTKVKWFQDELDQIWCKFSIVEDDVLTDLVWPASRVVLVEYQK